jgi:hypothetical protein
MVEKVLPGEKVLIAEKSKLENFITELKEKYPSDSYRDTKLATIRNKLAAFKDSTTEDCTQYLDSVGLPTRKAELFSRLCQAGNIGALFYAHAFYNNMPIYPDLVSKRLDITQFSLLGGTSGKFFRQILIPKFFWGGGLREYKGMSPALEIVQFVMSIWRLVSKAKPPKGFVAMVVAYLKNMAGVPVSRSLSLKDVLSVFNAISVKYPSLLGYYVYLKTSYAQDVKALKTKKREEMMSSLKLVGDFNLLDEKDKVPRFLALLPNLNEDLANNKIFADKFKANPDFFKNLFDSDKYNKQGKVKDYIGKSGEPYPMVRFTEKGIENIVLGKGVRKQVVGGKSLGTSRGAAYLTSILNDPDVLEFNKRLELFKIFKANTSIKKILDKLKDLGVLPQAAAGLPNMEVNVSKGTSLIDKFTNFDKLYDSVKRSLEVEQAELETAASRREAIEARRKKLLEAREGAEEGEEEKMD